MGNPCFLPLQFSICHFARSRNPLLSFRKKPQSTFVISQEDAVEIEISCTAGRSKSVQLAVAVFSRSRSLSIRKKPQSTFVISQEDAVEIEISCNAGRSKSVQLAVAVFSRNPLLSFRKKPQSK
jgi:acyl-CoA hydrolase